MLLTLLLLTAPVAAQEAVLLDCENTQESVLCPSEDDGDTSWDFLDNFSTPCDSFYGCGINHPILLW